MRVPPRPPSPVIGSALALTLWTCLAASPVAAQSSSGANTRSIPLAMPPGVGGIAPSLSLQYSSHSRAPGPVGLGWSLPTSSIRLDEPGLVSQGETDWFLDGAPLVEEIDPVSGEGTGRYRPELLDGSLIEEQYDPIEGSSFLVATPDGWLYEYGTTKDARIADCAGDCETRVAMLSRAVDPHGLSVRYFYDGLGDEGRLYLVGIEYSVDRAAESGLPRLWDESDLSHPASVGVFSKVVLRYEAAESPRTAWVGGRKVETRSQLNQIEQYVDENLVRRYDLDYAAAHAGALLERVTEEAWDLGGHHMARELVALEYSPDGLNWSGWNEEPVPMPCATVLSESDESGTRLDWFDLDGIGSARCVDTNETDFSELLLADPDTGTVLADLIDLDGDGHLDRVEWWEEDPTGGSICPTGDCLVWRRKNGFERSWALPQRIELPGVVPGFFTPPSLAARETGFDYRVDRTLSGFFDLTGDGLRDYVMTSGTTWAVFRNLGEGEFDAQQLWTGPGPELGLSMTQLYYTGDSSGAWPINQRHRWRSLVDLNGDGLLDYLDASPDIAQQCDADASPLHTCSWALTPGTGAGFAQETELLDTGFYGVAHDTGLGWSFHGFASQRIGSIGVGENDQSGTGHGLQDLDGDGLLDIALAWEDDSSVAFHDAGAGFLPAELWSGDRLGPKLLRTATPWSRGGEPEDTEGFQARAQDVDGDGRVDWFRELDGGLAVLRRVDDSGAPSLPPHLLTRMSWPSGAAVEFGYQLYEAKFIPSEGEAIRPSWNLSEVRWSRSDVGDLFIEYGDPVRAHGRQTWRELLVIEADGAATVSYAQGGVGEDAWPLIGAPLASQHIAPDGSLMLEVQHERGVERQGAHLVQTGSARFSTTFGSQGDERQDWEQSEREPLTGRLLRRTVGGDGLASRGLAQEWYSQPHPHLPDAEMLLLSSTEELLHDSPVPGTRVELTYDASGALVKTDRELVDPSGSSWHATWREVDSWGYTTRVTDPMGDSTDFLWGPDYREVVTEQNSGTHGHSALTRLHPWFGTPILEQRLGGLSVIEQSETVIDAFGRVVERWQSAPDDPSAMWLAEESRYQLDDAGPLWIERTVFEPGYGMSADEKVWLDEFGRLEQAYAPREVGRWSATWVARDSLGRVTQSSLPLGVDSMDWRSPDWLQPNHEVYFAEDGRTRSSWLANVGPHTRWQEQTWDLDSMGRLKLTQRDEDTDGLRETHRLLDGAGRLQRQQDALGQITEFFYSDRGQLERLTDPSGREVRLESDSWGRRIALKDPDISQCAGGPDACPWTWSYRPDGLVAERTDALGQTLSWQYDGLKRVTAECQDVVGPCDAGVASTTFVYDELSGPGHGWWELGALLQMTDESGTTEYTVDHWGRVREEQRTIAGAPFYTQYSYDHWGQLRSVDYDEFDGVEYDYDSAGTLSSVRERSTGLAWLDGLSRDPLFGGLSNAAQLGGAIERQFSYTQHGRLESYTTSAALDGWSGALQDIQLDFDTAGRVARQKDWVSDREEVYQYDRLDRLVQVDAHELTTGSFDYERSYAYGPTGAMEFNSLQAMLHGDGSYHYDAGSAHVLTGIGGHTSFFYDANGNPESRQSPDRDQLFHYGLDGRLRQIEDLLGGSTTTLAVDGHGQQVLQKVEVGSTVVEEVFTPNAFLEQRDGELIKVVRGAGLRLAEVPLSETDLGLIDAISQVQLVFEDHKGQQAARLTVEDPLALAHPAPVYINDDIVARDPYGVLLDGDDSPFTRAAAGGLALPTDEVQLGPRMYDPELGRFLQADVLASATAGMGQGLNRWRYGWNSPTNYADPSGYWEEGLLPEVHQFGMGHGHHQDDRPRRRLEDHTHLPRCGGRWDGGRGDCMGPVVWRPKEGDPGRPEKDPAAQWRDGYYVLGHMLAFLHANREEGLDSVQMLLSVLGMIPAYGEPFDALNAGISAARGRWGEAALSAASMLPLGDWAGRGWKALASSGDDALQAARGLDEVAELAGAVSRGGDEAAELATSAARASDEASDSVRGYRAVSQAEVEDIANHGGFRPNPEGGSMEDKWFSESRAGAGEYLDKYDDLTEIVEADVPRDVYERSLRDENIDLTGRGFCVRREDLPRLRRRIDR